MIVLLDAGMSAVNVQHFDHSEECLGDNCKHCLPAEWAGLSHADCVNAPGSAQLLCTLDAIGHVATRGQQDATLGSQADHQGGAPLLQLAQQQAHRCWVGWCTPLPAWPSALAWASANQAADCWQAAPPAAAGHQTAQRLQLQTLSALAQRRHWAGAAAGRTQQRAAQVAAAGPSCPAARRWRLAPPELAPAAGTGPLSAEATHAQQLLA